MVDECRRIDSAEVRAILGGTKPISDTTLWRLRQLPDFPRPLKITKGRIAWVEAEVRAYANLPQRIKTLPARRRLSMLEAA